MNLSFSSTRTNTNQHNQEVRDVSDACGMVKTLPKTEKCKKLATSKKPELAKITNKASEMDFLTFGAKTAFLHLWTAFTVVLILHHFDPKSHIHIKTNASGYVIIGIFSKLTSNQNFSGHEIGENLNSFKSVQ